MDITTDIKQEAYMSLYHSPDKEDDIFYNSIG